MNLKWDECGGWEIESTLCALIEGIKRRYVKCIVNACLALYYYFWNNFTVLLFLTKISIYITLNPGLYCFKPWWKDSTCLSICTYNKLLSQICWKYMVCTHCPLSTHSLILVVLTLVSWFDLHLWGSWSTYAVYCVYLHMYCSCRVSCVQSIRKPGNLYFLFGGYMLYCVFVWFKCIQNSLILLTW